MARRAAITISPGSEATLTNNSTIKVHTTLTGTGTLTQSPAGIPNINEVASITTLNASTAGNMFASKGNNLCKGSEFWRMIEYSMNNVNSCAEKTFAFLFPQLKSRGY